MKISSISVTKLFGIFNHKIEFKDENITILIGENGLGKTVILEMLNNIFRHRFKKVAEIKFEKLNVTFENGLNWSFKVGNKKNLQVRDTSKSANSWKDLHDTHDYDSNDPRKRRMYRYYNEYMRGQDDENISDYIHHFIFDKNVKQNQANPTWFINIAKKINIDLIETQRILTSYGEDGEKYRSTISDCAESLKTKLRSFTSESQKITAELDSSFPNRIIKAIGKKIDFDHEQINSELYDINEKRKKLSNLGLLTKIDIEEIQNIKKNEDSVLKFIDLYIQDSKNKLKPYDEIYEKLALFIKITNSRLKHKKLLACIENGFKIQSTILVDKEKKPVEFPFDKLSSGEQHEIILFYKLIFLYDNNSLILLDEPELSLHISWQNNFINDMKEIINHTNHIILISTHSPDIIGEHWHLTEELSGVSS